MLLPAFTNEAERLSLHGGTESMDAENGIYEN